MRKVFTSLFLFILISISFAQTRYKDELFSITKHADVVYGGNYDNNHNWTTLVMDIYEPQSDTATARPLIFFVHGGSFTDDNRKDQDIDKTAEFFAKKGYVTANIYYRVEQTTVISPYLNFADTYNWHRAIGRATQDLKAAIRFFKKDVATNNNSYKVDTSTMFIYGSSAGAITALHTVYLNDTIEMSGVFKAAYKSIGGLDGESGNPGYTIKGIKGVVSCSGAIEDLNYINNNSEIEYLAFHNNPDFTVPYGEGCFITIACWLGTFYGDSRIFPRMQQNGTYSEFYPINIAGHPVDQVADTATHRMILQKTTDFLYRIVQQNTVTSLISKNKSIPFSIFPNPTNGNFTLEIPKSIQAQKLNIEVVSVAGQQLFKQELQALQKEIPLHLNLEDGFYFVNITSDKGNYFSKIQVIH